ncbi:glycosyltransferase [Tenacibaculum sp. UWU-22]|uniref:glycosyltransferase n=1 Tax=Tenacibaculum sp. UWU-22 TaxID=3234187 RepID=UPI0034DB458F
MNRKKRILVVSEPYIIKGKGTTNNALNTILEYYTNYFGEVHCLAPSSENYNKFESNGVFYHSITGYEKRIIKRLYFILDKKTRFYQLDSIVNTIKPDIIQIRIPSVFSQVILNSLKRFKIPITSYIAGEWDEALKLNYSHVPLIGILSKLLFKSQNLIVRSTVPVCTGDKLAERFKSVNPLIHAYYSTTHTSIHRTDEKLKQESKFNLLTIGRLEKLKRVDDVIKAMSILIKKDYRYNLSILGDGNQKENLMNLVENLGLSKHVKFHGHISGRDNLDILFKDHDILVHPSLTEGTSKVLPEAMSYGLIPIAVDNVGSNNNIIERGSGFLVEPKSPNKIAKTVLDINSMEINLLREELEKGYNYAKKHTINKELDKMWLFVFNSCF